MAAKALIKRMKKHRDQIAKERDSLRELLTDIHSLVESCEEGLQALENAIDIFSEQA